MKGIHNTMSDEVKEQATSTSVSTAPILSTTMARLNNDTVPKLVGDGPKERARFLYQLLVKSNIPLYLIGDSGTGKTAAMLNILKTYSHYQNVPAYYFQLSPEDTKTSVILGQRLNGGSLVPYKGVIAQAAEEGAIVGIDEITHSTHQMLLALNSLDGDSSIISIGDLSINASKLKIVYGSNASNYVGNIKIPPSFANRVIGYPFEYPSLQDEVEIAKALSKRDFNGTLTVPDSMYRYIVKCMRDIRKPEWPLSVRNVAKAMVLLELSPKSVNAKIEKHFTSGNEAVNRTLTERIYGKAINDVTYMQRPEIVEFCQYVSNISLAKFREYIKIAMGYYVDIDGVDIGADVIRQNIVTQII